MGCDIHMVVERKVGERWIATHIPHWRLDGMQRNYERFAAIAVVRGDGPEPRGLPPDISETTRYWVDDWSADGHSHTWLTIQEAVPIFRNTDHRRNAVGTKPLSDDYLAYEYFGVDSGDQRRPISEFRVVIWFDN